MLSDREVGALNLGRLFFENQEEARRQVCAWAKVNREVWEPWLPIETNCFAGFGLVNEDDELAARLQCCVLCRGCWFWF